MIKAPYIRILRISVVLSLVIVYIAGLQREQRIMKDLVFNSYPEMIALAPLQTDPLIYEIPTEDSLESIYYVFSSGRGWGGPFTIVTEVDHNAIVKHIEILKHCETPAYLLKLENKHFFEQFTDQKSTSAFILGAEIDAVCGATISSTGFTDAIRSGCHSISSKVFELDYELNSKAFKPGIKEIIILLIFILTYIGSICKIKKMRFVTLILGMVFIGFMFNVPVSVSQFASIFLGYVPSPVVNLTWWLMIAGALLLIIITRKNLYCAWICPFGAVQEFISGFSGFSLPLNSKIVKFSSFILYFFTFLALAMMFYFRNTSIGNYEPFAALFNFDGYGLIWLILPLALFSSFFWKRFYCRFFCPAGAALTLTVKLRRAISMKSNKNRTPKAGKHGE